MKLPFKVHFITLQDMWAGWRTPLIWRGFALSRLALLEGTSNTGFERSCVSQHNWNGSVIEGCWSTGLEIMIIDFTLISNTEPPRPKSFQTFGFLASLEVRHLLTSDGLMAKVSLDYHFPPCPWVSAPFRWAWQQPCTASVCGELWKAGVEALWGKQTAPLLYPLFLPPPQAHSQGMWCTASGIVNTTPTNWNSLLILNASFY